MLGTPLAGFLLLGRKVFRRLRMWALRPAFKKYGRHFLFDPDGCYTFRTIEVGDDVTLGERAILVASDSRIIIGNKVMFGPGVTIIGGDHNTSVVGAFMYDVFEKRPQDDQDVIIEDDVWVGANALILKGVRLGRGSIVAAGSLVYRDVPPYTTVAGVPAVKVNRRFDIETILAHEKVLYSADKRLERSYLEKVFGIR
jgi:acetyltransferase-like isoleucine patch superfamily enzyme